jgi:hypothetical protein
MKKQFRKVKFRGDSLLRINEMQSIVSEYAVQDLRLTARQLYYQLVSRDLIPNEPAEYKKVTSLLTDARYAGLIDWDAIEDRGSVPDVPSEWSGLPKLVEAALRSYRRPRWEGQVNHVELWVEKQALAGVLAPIADEFHVTLMVNKGYSSASAMYEAAQRMFAAGKPPIVFYLGDHDPSGEDMVRDIRARLEEFLGGNMAVDVRKIALTMAQVRRHRPPPNPAKITDPRAASYCRIHGDSSWEVDALPPDVLARLIRSALGSVLDVGKMDVIKEREESDKAQLRLAVSKLIKRTG